MGKELYMKSDIFKIKEENLKLKEKIRTLESELNMYRQTFENIKNIFNKPDKNELKTSLKIIK